MTTRRKFFGGAAALAAPLAAAAAVGADGGDDLTARPTALEETNAIRVLLHDYAQRVNAGSQRAPTANVRSITLDATAAIDIAANGTATAHAPCTVEVAMPIHGDETLVEMARQQGDGVVRHRVRGVLAGSLIKHNGTWNLERTELHV
jgi:hypothetical protein